MKKKIDERYSHADLPRPKNLLLNAYRAFMKLFFIFVIGAGSIVIALIIFPCIHIFVHPKKRFQAAGRKFISMVFTVIIFLIKTTGTMKVYVDELDKLKNLKSNVIVSNHCCALDFVLLMSLVPTINCIVAEWLTKTPLTGVIRQVYILNTTDFDELCRRCKETLDMGNNVLIFPEGTRTPRHGSVPYKKGAARIAQYAGCDIQPLLIGGSDKYGLGKHDPAWSFNHEEPLIFDIKILEPIKIADYAEFSLTVGAKKITEKIHSEILEAAEEEKKNHPRSKTLNNIT